MSDAQDKVDEPALSIAGDVVRERWSWMQAPPLDGRRVFVGLTLEPRVISKQVLDVTEVFIARFHDGNWITDGGRMILRPVDRWMPLAGEDEFIPERESLTPAQLSVLRDALASPLGVATARLGERFATFERVSSRLAQLGLVQRYVHGGYEITDAGRRAEDVATRSAELMRAWRLERLEKSSVARE